MTRRYPTEVPTRQVLTGVLVALLLGAAVVGLSRWLVLPSQLEPELGAGLDPGGAPDATACSFASAQPAPVEAGASLLVECAEEFDGRTVVYEGEVVESVLRRGARAFVTLNDDPYSGEAGPIPEHRTQLGGNAGIAVSLPAAAADRITTLGSYRARGDRLAVVGTYRAADPAAGGAPVITADSVTITAPGRPLPHSPAQRRLVVAGLLAAATLATVYAHRRGIHWPWR